MLTSGGGLVIDQNSTVQVNSCNFGTRLLVDNNCTVYAHNSLWQTDSTITNSKVTFRKCHFHNNVACNKTSVTLLKTTIDDNFNVIRNIQSERINISDNEWVIITPRIYQKNNYNTQEQIRLNTNFNSDRIRNLYSNLSALNFFELFELRKNYLKLNYSLTDINLHIFKLLSFSH